MKTDLFLFFQCYIRLIGRGDNMLKLDMKKISDRIVATIPTDEALKNTKPFEWSDEVVSGQKKAVISKAVIEENNPCVKLGTLF